MTISTQLRYQSSTLIQLSKATRLHARLHSSARFLGIQRREYSSFEGYSNPTQENSIPRATKLTAPRSGHVAWDAVLTNLETAKSNAVSQLRSSNPQPAEEMWKKRSSKILNDLTMSRAGVGTTIDVNSGFGRMKNRADGAFAGDVQVLGVGTGRTVSNADFQTAIRMLNSILSRNRVRREWQRDRYFTKPAALRYQLRSQRHRKRFAAMVRRKVQIVQAIKRRGM